MAGIISSGQHAGDKALSALKVVADLKAGTMVDHYEVGAEALATVQRLTTGFSGGSASMPYGTARRLAGLER